MRIFIPSNIVGARRWMAVKRCKAFSVCFLLVRSHPFEYNFFFFFSYELLYFLKCLSFVPCYQFVSLIHFLYIFSFFFFLSFSLDHISYTIIITYYNSTWLKFVCASLKSLGDDAVLQFTTKRRIELIFIKLVSWR